MGAPLFDGGRGPLSPSLRARRYMAASLVPVGPMTGRAMACNLRHTLRDSAYPLAASPRRPITPGNSLTKSDSRDHSY